MKWAYDLTGAEPIIRDEIVYDAAAINIGELLMLAPDGDFTVGTGGNYGLVTAYSSTAPAAHAVDAVGISLEAKTTSSVPSVATATDTTAEPCYVKTIINPFAVYRAEVSTVEQAAITSWATTHLVIATSASVANYLGWVYFSATGGPNFGELRMVMNTFAAGTVETDSAPKATATTADYVTFIHAKNQYADGLDDTAVMVEMATAASTHMGGTNLRIVETWVDGDQGLEVMKQHVHKACSRKKGSKVAKFYNDIMMKDHAFGVQEN